MSEVPGVMAMMGVAALLGIAMALISIAVDVHRIADVAERESEDLGAGINGQ